MVGDLHIHNYNIKMIILMIVIQIFSPVENYIEVPLHDHTLVASGRAPPHGNDN